MKKCLMMRLLPKKLLHKGKGVKITMKFTSITIKKGAIAVADY